MSYIKLAILATLAFPGAVPVFSAPAAMPPSPYLGFLRGYAVNGFGTAVSFDLDYVGGSAADITYPISCAGNTLSTFFGANMNEKIRFDDTNQNQIVDCAENIVRL